MIPIPDRLAMKLIAAVGCVMLLVLLVHDRNRWKARSEINAGQLAAERAAHAATIANIRAATERARLADAANASRVRGEQASINERTEHAFETRIAAARAFAGRLRGDEASASRPGDGGATTMPGLPTAPGRAAQAAGQNGFPGGDRLIATEQAIQLDELIGWVRRQAAVDPNADRPADQGLNRMRAVARSE